MTAMPNMDRHAQITELTGLVLDSDPAGLSDTWPALITAGLPVINSTGTNVTRNAELARVARRTAESETDPTLIRTAQRIAEIATSLA